MSSRGTGVRGSVIGVLRRKHAHDGICDECVYVCAACVRVRVYFACLVSLGASQRVCSWWVVGDVYVDACESIGCVTAELVC